MQMDKQKLKTIKAEVKYLYVIIPVKMLTNSENVPRRKKLNSYY